MKEEDIKNCPNCGAPIEHRYNHQCPFCKTFFDYRVKQTEEINPRYLQNVELKYIEREPQRDKLIFVFVGDYIKWQESIEYTQNNTKILLSVDDIKPKKIHYAIAFNFDEVMELQQNNFRPLFEVLPFEIDKHQLIKAIHEFNGGRSFYG